VLGEVRLDLAEPSACPVLEPRVGDVVFDPVEAKFAHGGIIDAISGTGYGPFGSTSRTAGPTTGGDLYENPEATENEQELAQTDFMEEDEEQRSGYAPADETNETDETDDDFEDKPDE
jgi:hypothetical protein